MSEAIQPDREAALQSAAMRLLASRDYGRAELERKLSVRFGRAGLVQTVLDDLEERGLLSERRFVESYIDQRCRKGFGPLRIRSELAQRGVAGEAIEQGFDAASIDWEEALRTAAERKFGVVGAEDRQALARRGRFLEQRGFPISLIRRYLDRLSTG